MAEDTPTPPAPTPESTSAPAPAEPNPSATPRGTAPVPEAAANVAAPADPAAQTAATSSGAPDPGNPPDEVSIDELLKQASFEDPSALGTAVAVPDAADFRLPNFQQVMQDAQVSSIELLRDVELNVKIELGRARMLVEDVLKLSEGSVVELDKLAGDPVDVFVNDRLIARGEVLVLNENFCVRVNEIVAGVKEEGT